MSKLDELKNLRDNLNIKINGKENIPEDAPYVMISNYDRRMNIVYVPSIVDQNIVSLLDMSVIKGNTEYSDQYLHVFPLDSNPEYQKICLDYANQMLLEGVNINMFPEIQLTKDNKLHKGTTSVSKLIFNSLDYYNFVYLLPVAVKHSPNVEVTILKPINPLSYYRKCQSNPNDMENIMQSLVDDGMLSMAYALKKEYTYENNLPEETIITFPSKKEIAVNKASDEQFKNMYSEELKELSLKLISECGDGR